MAILSVTLHLNAGKIYTVFSDSNWEFGMFIWTETIRLHERQKLFNINPHRRRHYFLQNTPT